MTRLAVEVARKSRSQLRTLYAAKLDKPYKSLASMRRRVAWKLVNVVVPDVAGQSVSRSDFLGTAARPAASCTNFVVILFGV